MVLIFMILPVNLLGLVDGQFQADSHSGKYDIHHITGGEALG
jgi:hypothetical protein